MKKLNKNIFVIIISVFLMLVCLGGFIFFSKDDDKFDPVLRFIVASDVHVADSGSDLEEERLKNVFEVAYKYASKNKEYKKVDAFLFAGDITNAGTINSFNKFNNIIRENVKGDSKLIVSLGNHDFYTDPNNTINNFRDIFDTYEDEHLVINGFHFIKISPSDGNSYNKDKQEWLDNELSKASLDTPSLPIFVMQHHHIKGTVYGSTIWGVDELSEVLNKYHQVVDFSGHSHFPIMDERNIHQDKFTSIGTGTLSYYEIGLNGVASELIFPTDYEGGYANYKNNNSRDAAQFQIIEVNKEGKIKIIGYDLISNKEIFQRYIENPGDITNFVTNEEKKNSSGKPIYLPHDKVKVLNSDSSSAELLLPKPASVVNVESYIVEVYKDNQLIEKIHRLSGYIYLYNYDIKCYIDNLESDTEYDIKVYAVNVYGTLSEPIKVSVKTS